MFRKLAAGALLAAAMSTAASAQNAATVIANATKAMGAEGLTSITYSGTAMNGNFGQSKTIAGPLAMTNITAYTRSIDFNQPASRAFGPTMPPAVPGGPPPQAGNFNQNITPANAAWTQQLEIWITPWGFLKGAAANNATVRADRGVNVVSWMPAQKAPSGQSYRLNGYINAQNMVERVETWVEHPVVGDLHVDTTYAAYQDFGGLKVPTRITQTRAGIRTFEATLTAATANPPNITALLTPPPPPQGAPGGGGGGQQAAAAPPAVQSEKLADGVYRITGGYVALAVEMRDHVVVIEGGQSEARGLAVIAETRRVIPNKPIRYVVNTHMHFDHSSGLAPFAAEGIAIVTHENNKAFLEKALGNPRTLAGDALAKSNRKPVVEAAGDRRTLSDDTHTIELYNVRNLEHSDGMLAAYLPKEKILLTADFNVPAPNAPMNPSIPVLQQNVDRLNLDVASHILVHAPNPDRPLNNPELLAIANGAN